MSFLENPGNILSYVNADAEKILEVTLKCYQTNYNHLSVVCYRTIIIRVAITFYNLLTIIFNLSGLLDFI